MHDRAGLLEAQRAPKPPPVVAHHGLGRDYEARLLPPTVLSIFRGVFGSFDSVTAFASVRITGPV